jgi:D-alanyl-D-alanine carboxypeptidase (penicillin-binding protein 5/6)
VFLFAAAVGSPALAASHARGQADGRFAAIAIDADSGRVLYARSADARRYPASLTKVMTLYLAFDALDAGKLHLSDRIVMSPHAAAQAPTRLGLAAGRSLTVKEALDVIVVKSANDVAVALAERLAGSEGAFVKRMNRKARQLGMTHTHFANASGLPNPHNVSTARDLARLGQALIRRHPERYDLFDKEQATFRGRVIPGHNHLLSHRGIDGIKTGYTRASGYNLLSSGERHGRRVVAVVLGGRTARSRDAYMGQLLETSFDDAVRLAHHRSTKRGPKLDRAHTTETVASAEERAG